MSEFMINRSTALTDILDNSSQYPGIVLDSEGTSHVCWQEYKDRHDVIYAAKLIQGKAEGKVRISGEGEALRPVLCSFGKTVWYSWSECIGTDWFILARYERDGIFGPIVTVAKGEATFYPYLFVEKDKLAVVYNEQGKGFSRCVFGYLSEDGLSGREILSQSEKSYRPTACVGEDGNTYLVYDSFNGKGYDLLVRVKVQGTWSGETKVNQSANWATRPIVVSGNGGAVVCWYDFGDLATFCYCTADIREREGKPVCGDVQILSSNKNWYHDISASSNSKGTAVFAYTWGKYNINVRYRQKGGQWSEPVVMSYDDTHCAVHPSVFIDEQDEIHLLWQYANKNGHMDRNACIVHNTMKLSEMEPHFDKVVETSLDQFVQPIPAHKTFESRPEEEVKAWLKKNGYGDCLLLFGDIHGQSGISDGVGEIDQYYHYARVRANLDFTALTDHDCYPDWISQSEWEWMRTTNRLMNTDGQLSCFLAYEWTPNEYRYDYGHKNIYYRGDDGDIFRSCDVGGMTPFNLFESLKQYKAMAFPHHPAADWGLVSAATDWNFHDPQIQRLVEIFSRHANFEDFESTSKYTKNIRKLRGHSVQDALAKKYHMGFTAGSDSHQMEHGIEGGIFAVMVPQHTREDIYDAMYDRFTYATTGARILVSLKSGTAHMGQEIKVKYQEPLLLDVSVMSTEEAVVQLIKNNQAVEQQQTTNCKCEFSFKDAAWRNDDCYYVKVVQNDEHMAWSSPVWVTELQTR